jgi:flagellar protein FliO/FliZ
MTPTLFLVAFIVLAIALIPYGIKWLKKRSALGGMGGMDASRIVSAIAVGAHQRVLVLEVGPPHARVWLTLGVTASAINCLHKSVLLSSTEGGASDASEKLLVDKWNESRE